MKRKQTSLLRYNPNDFEIVGQDEFQDIEAMTLRDRACLISSRLLELEIVQLICRFETFPSLSLTILGPLL